MNSFFCVLNFQLALLSNFGLPPAYLQVLTLSMLAAELAGFVLWSLVVAPSFYRPGVGCSTPTTQAALLSFSTLTYTDKLRTGLCLAVVQHSVLTSCRLFARTNMWCQRSFG